MTHLSVDTAIASPPHDALSAGEDFLTDPCNGISSTVMAMIGHDLRQPLQVIMNERGILARSLIGSAMQVHLSAIEDAVLRLAGTLDQLVEIVRVQEVSPHDYNEPVSLGPILTDLVSEFGRHAARKGIKLNVRPASAVVASHPVLLTSMLRNLIRNAIDYTPAGGQVVVGCLQRAAEIHIEVRDTGAGIAARELSNIFQAFHRADTTRRDGLGLGLFIVKRAAELLGHRLKIRSTPGRGSSFVVAANLVSAKLLRNRAKRDLTLNRRKTASRS